MPLNKYSMQEKIENFIKLKNPFKVDPYIIKDLRISFGKKVNDTFKGIWYSNVEFDNKDQIFNVIPEHSRKYFGISIMEVNTYIPPHTDSSILVTINFYIKTNGCTTQFFKFKDTNITKTQIENQTNGFLFNPNDLDSTDRFVAQDNDVYLLDVSKPHSVIPQSISPVYRTAICLQSRDCNFDDTVKLLQETNSI